ncbi:MAG: ABC transporter permease subunit [Rhodothermales bacterium]
MLRLLIRKEIREIVYSTKFVLTFGAMSVLILLSFYTGALNYQHALDEGEAAAAELEQNLQNRTSWIGVQASTYLTPRPLEAVVTGLSNDLARSRTIWVQPIAKRNSSRYSEEPVWAMFRSIDLEFILTVVLSLFAIVFAYDSVSGERERGTLSLAMSNSVPRSTFLLGKIVGTFAALFIPLLVPMLLGALMLPLLGVPIQGDDWLRLSLILATGGLYLSLFLILSTFVSSLVKRSSAAFLALSITWIMLVIVLPRLAIVIAGRSVDVPSKESLDFEIGKARFQQFENLDGKLGDAMRNVDLSHITREEYDSTINTILGGLLADQVEQESNNLRRLRENQRNRRQQREALALSIARVSPATSMRLVATRLANTGVDMASDYEDVVDEYESVFRSFVVGKEGKAAFTGNNWRPFTPGARLIDPAELPRAALVRPSLSSDLNESLPDLALLLLFNLVTFAFAFQSFSRCDLRQPPG